MKTKLTGNELLHFLFLKALSCRVQTCKYLFKIANQFDKKWLRYSQFQLSKTGNENQINKK